MTVGREIDEEEDCDYPYLGDVVRQAALDGAMAYTQDYLRQQLGMKSVGFLNPGSQEDWSDKLINKAIAELTKAEDIGIQVDDIFGPGGPHATVARLGKSPVLLVHYPHALILRRQLVGNRPRAVGRAIVHNHHLDVTVGLHQCAGHAALQVGRSVISRNDD